jgi:hypothetical protein
MQKSELKQFCEGYTDKYFTNQEFLDNDKYYRHLDYQYVHTAENNIDSCENITTIHMYHPKNIISPFFGEIGINHQELIQSIEFYTGGMLIEKIDNIGNLFAELRKLLKIENNNIIPFTFLYKRKFPFLPYSEHDIVIKSNEKCNFQLKYNVYRVLENIHHKWEYLFISSYSANVMDINNLSSMNFFGTIISFIMLHLPNNGIEHCKMIISKNNNNFILEPVLHKSGEWYIINFADQFSVYDLILKSINLVSYINVAMNILPTNNVVGQTVHIHTIYTNMMLYINGICGLKFAR